MTQKTNQFTNYGWAAKELEIRARDMLKIDESKAVNIELLSFIFF